MKLIRFALLSALMLLMGGTMLAQGRIGEGPESFSRSGRLVDLSNRLVQQSERLSDAAYSNYSNKNNNDRSDAEALILAQHFDTTAGLFRRLVQDRRRRSELRDVAQNLSDLIRQSERYGAQRSEWSNIRRTVNDIFSELNLNNGGGGGGTGYGLIEYRTHLAELGWQDYVRDGEAAGTTGESRQMEAIAIRLNNISGNLRYRVYVAGRGWTDWSNNGSVAGTTGQGRAIEGIRIELRNTRGYDIQYQVHIADMGWTDWQSNGNTAGEPGRGRAIEAIRIRLVRR
jgi:hypothetical protein